MNQPRLESRVSALEKRASTLEAQIGELSSDTAESLRDLKQDIKQLNDGMMASFVQIGDAFTLTWDNIEANLATKEDLARVETTMATKEDLSKLEGLFDKMEATQDQILQLLQQKSLSIT